MRTIRLQSPITSHQSAVGGAEGGGGFAASDTATTIVVVVVVGGVCVRVCDGSRAEPSREWGPPRERTAVVVACVRVRVCACATGLKNQRHSVCLVVRRGASFSLGICVRWPWPGLGCGVTHAMCGTRRLGKDVACEVVVVESRRSFTCAEAYSFVGITTRVGPCESLPWL